ncbi:MAG TPA: flagellar hook assembly protein FlgD [Polyangiaceae bacterium]|jgi:flagellar basal-body rod modification protein FlgD|nr:flagellar hook assembly protein FlgD [Polyangiaceae bacterium]
MVDSVSSSSNAQASLAQAVSGGKNMGRDEFLKLLVAQLKNQDPLKPQDNSSFVAELAQFSSLEQSIGMNDRLDMLALQQKGQANSQAVSLVGQVATVKGSIITLDGSGSGTQISFDQVAASASTIVKIADQSGQVVRTIDLGSRPTGVNTIRWDGRDDTGTVQPKGSYAVSVVTKDDGGNPIGVTQTTSAKVQAVSFDQGYPVLHLANGVAVPVSDLIQINTPTST